MLGFSFVTWVGLMTVAACHYLGVARLTVLVLVAQGGSSPEECAIPAFGQALFAAPRDATGKIVCANCHLSSAAVEFSTPQRLSIRVLPQKRTSQLPLVRLTPKSGAMVHEDHFR